MQASEGEAKRAVHEDVSESPGASTMMMNLGDLKNVVTNETTKREPHRCRSSFFCGFLNESLKTQFSILVAFFLYLYLFNVYFNVYILFAYIKKVLHI